MLTRSQFVSLASTAALSWAAQPLVAASAEPARSFAVASDPHYISPRLTDNGAAFTQVVCAADGKVTLKSEALLDAFVAQLASQAPSALILTGDLTFNGARESHEDLAAKLAPLLDQGVRVAVLPGNHDINCSQAARFAGDTWEYVDSVDAAVFRAIWERFGFADAVSCDDASLSYVWPLFDDVWLLMLDSFGSEHPGSLGPQTLAWLAGVLDEAREQGVCVVGASHQNLCCHCALFGNGFMLGDAAELDELYQAAGVTLNLSGHIHIQHTATATGGTFEAATSALSVTPNQYTFAQLDETGLLSCTSVAVDVSSWAAAHNADDPDLADFASYAQEFFDTCSRANPYDDLVEAGLGEAEARASATAVQAANRAYFAGRTDLIDWDDPDLARALGRTSLEAYLQVLRGEEPRDHTRYQLQLL